MKVQMPASTAMPKFLDSLAQSRQTVSLEPLLKFADQSITKMSSSLAKIQDAAIDDAKCLASEEIRIEVIDERDTVQVLDMLKEFFFQDEPLNTFLNLGECKELEEYASKSLPERCSFKAVNSKGDIVGVAVNGVISRPATAEPGHSYAENCKHAKFRKILGLMEYIDSQFSVFDLYPNIDSYLDAKILSVNSNYRGCGIAGKLMERTMQHMRENSLNVIHVLCTSNYSARVCEKMNFRQVYELPYVDYVVNGENPLQPAAPHQAVKILVQDVQ